MQLQQVEIQRFRNLNYIKIHPVPGLNLIYGANASGKTSLLEAIYLLSHGRSFRTANIRSVIQQDSEALQVVGQIKQEKTSTLVNLGIERGHSHTYIRINQNTVNQSSRLAAYLPVQIINPEAHRLLELGPSQRRKYLDWGLFHVEPAFHQIWQHYTRILKQRNAALRQRATAKDITIWDQQLLEVANKLTQLRLEYVSQLLPHIQRYTTQLLDLAPQVEYRQGWAQDMDMEMALNKTLEQDRQQGYSRVGPHRADLRLMHENIPVRDKFSRGQQKLLVCALRLAQISHLKQQNEQTSVVLVDDLAAELDLDHRNRLLELLSETGAQMFVTVTEAELINTNAWESQKMFHVEHGQVLEMI